MEINRNNVLEIVNRSGNHPDKDYGQNFLIEPSIAEKICCPLDLSVDDYLLEVGPGLGSLTHFLCGKCSFDACDIDKRMIDFLKIIYPENINYICEDVRKINVKNYTKIIGNLPYNITTELISFFLINASLAKTMVFMCQQEAANHIFDEGGKEYGPLSILVHLLGSVEKVLIVKPGSFYPAPKCNSLVFLWKRNVEADQNLVISTYKMCKSLFINRRKTILNNLKNYCQDKEKAASILQKLNLSESLRPEDISPIKYLEMYKILRVDYND